MNFVVGLNWFTALSFALPVPVRSLSVIRDSVATVHAESGSVPVTIKSARGWHSFSSWGSSKAEVNPRNSVQFQQRMSGVSDLSPHTGKNCGFIDVPIINYHDPIHGLRQTIDARRFRGSTISISAFLKTVDVREGACLFVRSIASDGTIVAEEMAGVGVKGSSDWKNYLLVFDVSKQTEIISFGARLNGVGKVWVDDFVLKSIPSPSPRSWHSSLHPGRNVAQVDSNSDEQAPGEKENLGSLAAKVSGQQCATSNYVFSRSNASPSYLIKHFKGTNSTDLLQSVDAYPYVGRSFRLGVDLKGLDQSGVEAYVEADYSSAKKGEFLAARTLKLSDRTKSAWVPLTVSAYIPVGVQKLRFGIVVDGGRRVKLGAASYGIFDDFKYRPSKGDLVDHLYDIGEKEILREVTNLGFED